MKTTGLACLFICLVQPAAAGEKSSVDLLIVYYSAQGHTRSIAQAVAKGASSIKGVTVKILPVEEAKAEHAVQADAIILGSPVYNATVAPALQNFINSWPIEGQLRDKVGAAFATGGGISGGEELVQTTILHSMLVFGMVVVGGPNWFQPFGASGIVKEGPFDASKHLDLGHVEPIFLEKGEALGKRVALFAMKLKRNP